MIAFQIPDPMVLLDMPISTLAFWMNAFPYVPYGQLTPVRKEKSDTSGIRREYDAKWNDA